MKIDDLRRVAKAARSAFGQHPDLSAVGIGERHVEGRNTNEYAICLFVEQKGRITGEVLPKTFRAHGFEVATDVWELPSKALVFRCGSLDGSDLIISANGRSGTLGLIAQEDVAPFRLFGITNAHVVANPNESVVGTSVVANIDGVSSNIGTVHAHTILKSDGSLNPPDVALIELNALGVSEANKYAIQAWPHQPIVGASNLSAAPQAGSRLEHSYASQATGFMQINSGTSPFEISSLPMRDPVTNLKIHFKKVFHAKVSGAVEAGHSGSALTRVTPSGDGRRLSGLVVGGMSNELFAFSWPSVQKTIREDFGIRL